jgi:hypothetical protein
MSVSTTIYNESDRRGHLRELVASLERLIPVARDLKLPQLPSYEAALVQARDLSESKFSQADLSSLSRSVPDALPRHRDWESNYLQRRPDGSVDLPAWIEALEAVLQPTLRAAEILRTIGHR